MSQIVEAITPEQIEQVRGLFRQYQAELPVHLRAFDSEVSGLPGEYGPPQGKLLLSTVAGQPIGCAGLRPFPLEATCEMKRLYVKPTFRGGKIGKELAVRVLQEARNLGYRCIRLDTHPPTMQAAVKMYRSLGFRDIPVVDGVGGLLYMEYCLPTAEWNPQHAS